MRLGLLGGTFDPIHVGHLIVAEQMRAARRLDRVLFIPTRLPPHKLGHDLEDSQHRLAMVRAAVADNEAFEASAIELDREGPSYSIDTVAQIKDRCGDDHKIFFIIGADTLPVLPTWRCPGGLVDQADFLTATRPGYSVDCWDELRRTFSDEQIARLKHGCIDTVPVGISSTLIRRRLRDGQTVRYLIPDTVERFIRTQGLYGVSKETSQ